MEILLEKKAGKGKFVLIQNSIIGEKTEAIINPANECLAHGGGVAGLISREGGPDIQRESDRKSPVETGSATYTTAGTLPYKYIIHTVGPIWRGGEENESALLESAVTSALIVAEKLKLESVSMPSISTGIFKYPLKPAISIIFHTILEFLQQKAVHLKEIHLCEHDPEKADLMKKKIMSIMPTELTENIMELK